MTLTEELLNDFSKNQMVRLSNIIGPNQEEFDELMELFLSKDDKVSSRAAWLLSHCVDGNPWLIDKHIKTIIINLTKKTNDAVKRNTLRVLQFKKIPEDLHGITVELCFKFLNSGKEPIAVRAHAMTILFNIVKIYPELKDELKVSIEDQFPFGSAGFKSRGKKILKSLDRL